MIFEKKVKGMLERFSELEQALASPDAFEDQNSYREMTREHAYLSDVKAAWDKVEKMHKALEETRELLESEADEEMVALLKEEIEELEKRLPALESSLETLLVPPDPNDNRTVILELRAGTGGDEAALFVGDCVRMYHLYADIRGWKCELLSSSPSEAGGFKEYIMAVSGPNVKRFLQYEAGTHRVQRIPATEASGRIHTSAITVAVLLEPSEEEIAKVEEKDLRIDTYRASGAGGQHVNVTDSAVRLTHIPTGIVVCCQDERSQHKNKDKAMRLLQVKLADQQRQERDKEEAETRASQVGTGDRSERIRTYNFPQNRVTDHRINLTLYHLDQVVQGQLDPFCEALVAHFYQQKLAT
ncbi:MAG: Peptide chain release factor 1 [Chlamydiae bacterium]|nr:Peptide chain release factor 1 [Chlamydiota bacterium]